MGDTVSINVPPEIPVLIVVRYFQDELCFFLRYHRFPPFLKLFFVVAFSSVERVKPLRPFFTISGGFPMFIAPSPRIDAKGISQLCFFVALLI